MSKKLFKFILFIAVLSFVFGYLLGPSRVYGIFFSQKIRAQVVDIKSFSGNENRPEVFSLELETEDGEIFIATSCEKTWAVISKKDKVLVKLYPAAPWSENDGAWVNAKLLNKLSNRKESE